LRTKIICIAVVAAAYAAFAVASPAQTFRSSGETGLVGIKLYDTGMRLLQVYGDPDEILPLGAVSATGGPGGRPAGGGKLGTGGGGGGGVGGGAGGVSLNTPFDFGDQMFQEQGLPDLQANGGGDGGNNPPQHGPQVGGAGGGAGGVAQAQSYLRWIYNRDGCRYSFILDKNLRIVQIEVIGLENRKVRTKKGIGFGNTFKDVMEAYSAPEGYQITGDTIVMRYLTRDKVAFRLNRLGPKKPHVVTAIVVAAGKA
jgi:hypothetical protein